MSTNIAIKEEAYAFLKSLKSGEKSFSDVILSFKQKNQRHQIMQFFGSLKDIDWDKRKKEMNDLRRSFEGRVR